MIKDDDLIFEGRTVYDRIMDDPMKISELRKLYETGHTDAFIADFLNVNIKSFKTWIKGYPLFKDRIDSWKALADDRVVKSMYEKAIGYTHKETKLFQHEGNILSKKIEKHYPPDYSAGSLWLRNRQRDEWKDIKDMSTKTELNVDGQLKVGAPQLAERIDLIEAKAIETTATVVEEVIPVKEIVEVIKAEVIPEIDIEELLG